METNQHYHLPVMLSECLEGLNIQLNGIYVDLTFGGGGHSRAILEKLGDQGQLFAFDLDADASENAINDPRFTLIPANFRYLKRFLKVNGVKQVDGILADLGVSSHQLDVPERGFSFRFQAALDMRMDADAEKTAEYVINNYSETELQHIFSLYGEITNAKTLAHTIVVARMQAPIKTTNQLKDLLEGLVFKGQKATKYFAQVFQALRIEVNEEIKALEEMLLQTTECLNEDGRLVIMSYHSLEDRLVKNFLKSGNLKGTLEKDFYGNVNKPFKSLGKMITASDVELQENPRSRSAKLRIGERTA